MNDCALLQRSPLLLRQWIILRSNQPPSRPAPPLLHANAGRFTAEFALRQHQPSTFLRFLGSLGGSSVGRRSAQACLLCIQIFRVEASTQKAGARQQEAPEGASGRVVQRRLAAAVDGIPPHSACTVREQTRSTTGRGSRHSTNSSRAFKQKYKLLTQLDGRRSTLVEHATKCSALPSWSRSLRDETQFPKSDCTRCPRRLEYPRKIGRRTRADLGVTLIQCRRRQSA